MVTYLFSLLLLTALVQRISSCSKIQNALPTPDKMLNVLMYGPLRYDEIQYVGEHVK